MVKAENCPRFFLFGRRVSCLCCLWYQIGKCGDAKDKCPYNDKIEFCGENACSDNTFCIEKPWVKNSIDYDLRNNFARHGF